MALLPSISTSSLFDLINGTILSRGKSFNGAEVAGCGVYLRLSRELAPIAGKAYWVLCDFVLLLQQLSTIVATKYWVSGIPLLLHFTSGRSLTSIGSIHLGY